jgi:oligosaccharide repeat unit polymerase
MAKYISNGTSLIRRPIATHPTTIYACMWLVVIALTSLNLIDRLAVYSKPAITIAAMLIGSNVLGVLIALPMTRRTNKIHRVPSKIEFKFIPQLTIAWLIISIIEVYISDGLPIWWQITHAGRTYEDFGVKSIHGFANAVWIFLSFSSFIKFRQRFNTKNLIVFVALFSWPVLVISRALMTIAVLQCALFYVMTTKTSWRKITLSILLLAIVFILAFGYAGDMRATEFSIAQVSGFGAEVGNEKGGPLTALIWIYAYMVSPAANLALHMTLNLPQGNVIPTNTLAPLLPSFARNMLGFDTGFTGYLGDLAHDAFNVGTGFNEIYFDWGAPGVYGMAFVIGLVGHVFWASAKRVQYAPMLCAFGAACALTVFTNQFTQLPILVDFILLGLLVRVPKHAKAAKQTLSPPTPQPYANRIQDLRGPREQTQQPYP